MFSFNPKQIKEEQKLNAKINAISTSVLFNQMKIVIAGN